MERVEVDERSRRREVWRKKMRMRGRERDLGFPSDLPAVAASAAARRSGKGADHQEI